MFKEVVYNPIHVLANFSHEVTIFKTCTIFLNKTRQLNKAFVVKKSRVQEAVEKKMMSTALRVPKGSIALPNPQCHTGKCSV